MYHVILIGIISLILYLLTYTGSKYGILTTRDHRAFWNIILLTAFIITASAGIFLALQAGYEWDITGVEKILHWHVEAGLALSFTGLVHLTWHLSYYRKILIINRKGKDTPSATDSDRHEVTGIRRLLFMLGFLSGTVQVIFLKEALNLSGGYEIAAGVVFACWILVSALGARLGGGNSNVSIRSLSLALPLSAVISFVLFAVVSKLILDEGVTPGILYTSVITTVSLIPFCIISGFMFVRLSYSGVKHLSVTAGKLFAVETAGGIISGIFVTLLSGNLLGNFQLFISAVIIYLVIITASGRQKAKYVIIMLLLSTGLAVLLFSPDHLIRNILIGSVRITESRDSRYGNIAVGDYMGEKNIFYNHRLTDYEEDTRQREEDIHYAMLQSDNPIHILIISGGIEKHLDEVLKYPSVKTVTYIERDPVLTEVMDYKAISNDNADIITDDAFTYIGSTKKKFDVIISLITGPENIITNRFYTSEFFLRIKDRLNSGGVFMIKTGSSQNYIGRDETGYLSSIFNSLDDVFVNVEPVMGGSLYLIASDKSLTTDIPSRIRETGIENVYVNPDYLNEAIISFSSGQILEGIDRSVRPNTLDRPLSVFYYQKYRMKKNGGDSLILIIVAGVLLFLPFLAANNDSKMMYSTSLNLAGTEIMALILIQSTAGNFYQLAGLLLAVVMGGLAAGSSVNYMTGNRVIGIFPLLLAVTAFLYSCISHFIISLPGNTVPVIISMSLVIIPAFMTGYYYRHRTSETDGQGRISAIYFSDLTGSALGFLIIAGIIVPLFGIKYTFIILAIINFASYITSRAITMTGRLIKR